MRAHPLRSNESRSSLHIPTFPTLDTRKHADQLFSALFPLCAMNCRNGRSAGKSSPPWKHTLHPRRRMQGHSRGYGLTTSGTSPLLMAYWSRYDRIQVSSLAFFGVRVTIEGCRTRRFLLVPSPRTFRISHCDILSEIPYVVPMKTCGNAFPKTVACMGIPDSLGCSYMCVVHPGQPSSVAWWLKHCDSGVMTSKVRRGIPSMGCHQREEPQIA